MPTDVNWAVSKDFETVQLSPHRSDTVGRLFTLARELSDATSALLYNLGDTITLQAKSVQRGWRL